MWCGEWWCVCGVVNGGVCGGWWCMWCGEWWCVCCGEWWCVLTGVMCVPSPHHDTLSGISYLPNVNQSNDEDPQLKVTTKDAGRYVTASRDGAVCIWKSNLTCSRTIYVRVCMMSVVILSLTTPSSPPLSWNQFAKSPFG